jgi:hypothetical protein
VTALGINTKEAAMPDQESERLKRIRERQLTDRDPLAGERKFQRVTSVKEKRMYKPLSLKKELKAVPYVIKVPLYCLILGVIITAVLLITWNSPYALYVGVGAIVILLLVGISLGSVIDYNKKIKDHLE